MSFLRTLGFCILLISSVYSATYDDSLSVECFLSLVEEEDSKKLISFFDEMEQKKISFEEGNSFLSELSSKISKNFGVSIPVNFISKALRSHNIFVRPFVLEVADLSDYFLFSRKNLGNFLFSFHQAPVAEIDEEISGKTVIGAVEILAGALLWIIPSPFTKAVGLILMGDGITRVGDGLVDWDEINKAFNQRFELQ